MVNYKNIPSDFTIKYKPEIYTLVEKLLSNTSDKDVPSTIFLLSLLGFTNGEKLVLDSMSGDEKREISIRTLYGRYSTDFDSYIGLIAILDNTDKNYNEVINQIAFERTEMSKKRFLEMENVKTFFEYFLGGLNIFDSKFVSPYSAGELDLVYTLHEYLIDDYSEIEKTLEKMVIEEEILNEEDI